MVGCSRPSSKKLLGDHITVRLVTDQQPSEVVAGGRRELAEGGAELTLVHSARMAQAAELDPWIS